MAEKHESIGDRVRRSREQLGWGTPRLAKEVKVMTAQSIQDLEGGKSRGTKYIVELAAALMQDPTWLSTGEGSFRKILSVDAINEAKEGRLPTVTEVVPADLPAHMAAVGAWPRTVPVLGTTVGGAEAAFLLNRGETIDFAKRPPTLAKSSQVFALYVQGDSMARWRMPGEIVYVDKRPAKAGDHVVVECHPDHEGEGHPAYLKQLVTQTGKVYRLRQYNPEKLIEIPISKVIAVFRVIEWSELAGL